MGTLVAFFTFSPVSLPGDCPSNPFHRVGRLLRARARPSPSGPFPERMTDGRMLASVRETNPLVTDDDTSFLVVLVFPPLELIPFPSPSPSPSPLSLSSSFSSFLRTEMYHLRNARACIPSPPPHPPDGPGGAISLTLYRREPLRKGDRSYSHIRIPPKCLEGDQRADRLAEDLAEERAARIDSYCRLFG
jgi:hypothetical protein